MITTKNLAKLAFFNAALSSSLYLFTARHLTPWEDESSPPEILNPGDFDAEYCFLKRINITSVRFMIDRQNWSAKSYVVGEFVLTENNNIYRCSTAGSSGSKPRHMSGIAIDDSGTAFWEFIESLSQNVINDFLTPTNMPLSNASERLFFTDEIKSIKIVANIVGTEDGNLPLDKLFRVIGLYANPFDRKPVTDQTLNATSVKNYGIPLAFKSVSPQIRANEQIDTFTFDIELH